MAIEPVVVQLRAKLASIATTNRRAFLDKLAPIHRQWHMAEMMDGVGTFQGSPIGFLSFHHEVLAVYQGKFAKKLTSGSMAKPLPPYPTPVDAETDPLRFSAALEGWHNGVHRNPRYGADFANPMKNVYMQRFWQFHKFINDKFRGWMKRNSLKYDDLNHTAV